MIRTGMLGLTFAALVLAGGAQAAPVTLTFNITAQNFPDSGGDPAPVDPVTGSFTATFDPTLTYTDATAGISGSLNLPLGSALAFSYNPSLVGGLFEIGGAFLGVNSIAGGTNDYFIEFKNAATNPTFLDLMYTQAGSLDTWDTRQGSVTLGTAVPEPLTLSLFGAGMAGAVAMRRRKAKG